MIPFAAFKIATQLIENRLLSQMAEPADISPDIPKQLPYRNQSVLSLLGKQNATATEPAPKVVTDTGKLNI
ncbi:MAG: hypothetical protein PVI90_00325 [Desulfobacteraceae bacterium]|jgi:hypothetical protein